MRKILIVGLVLLSLFLIYLANMDEKVYYVALGDSLNKDFVQGKEVFGYSHYVKSYLERENLLEKYTDDFAKNNTRITDVINDINENRKEITSFGEISLKNALIKADLVTLNINYTDIYDRLSFNINDDVYNYIDDLSYDLEKMFELMRQYCKEDIVFVGAYNPYLKKEADDALEYLKNKYKNICLEYDVIYVDISDINVLDEEALEKIGNKVISGMKKNLFET